MKKFFNVWTLMSLVFVSVLYWSVRMDERRLATKPESIFVDVLSNRESPPPPPPPPPPPKPLEMQTFKEFMANQTQAIQERIWNHQHPARCDEVQFVTTFKPWEAGYGSRQSYYRMCLTWAFIHNRVMYPACRSYPNDCSVVEEWTNCTHNHVVHSKDPIECYWDDNHTPQSLELRYAVPQEYSKPPFGYIWWHAQMQYYLTRLRPETEDQVMKEHERILGVNASYPDYGLHIRGHEKMEARHYSLEECFEKTIDEYPWHAPVNESGEEGSSGEEDNRPVVFLATDHEDAVASTNRYPEVKWKVQTGNSRENWAPKDKGYVIQNLVSILLLARSNVLTVTWSSNYGVMAFLLKMVYDDFCSNIYLMDNLFFLPSESFQYIQPYTYQYDKDSGIAELLDADGLYGISNGCTKWVPNRDRSIDSSQCVWDRRLHPIPLHCNNYQYPTTCKSIQSMYFGPPATTETEITNQGTMSNSTSHTDQPNTRPA